MDRAESLGTLSITVAWSPRDGVVEEVALEVSPGTTLSDCLDAAGLADRYPQWDPGSPAVGIWGRLRPLDTAVQSGDRVEVYRALQVDPMEARRARQRKQKATACSPRR